MRDRDATVRAKALSTLQMLAKPLELQVASGGGTADYLGNLHIESTLSCRCGSLKANKT